MFHSGLPLLPPLPKQLSLLLLLLLLPPPLLQPLNPLFLLDLFHYHDYHHLFPSYCSYPTTLSPDHFFLSFRVSFEPLRPHTSVSHEETPRTRMGWMTIGGTEVGRVLFRLQREERTDWDRPVTSPETRAVPGDRKGPETLRRCSGPPATLRAKRSGFPGQSSTSTPGLTVRT